MAKVFNLGIGMIVVVPEDERYKALDVLRAAGQRAVAIGRSPPAPAPSTHLTDARRRSAA